MDFLGKIFNELLLEDVNTKKVGDAIKKRRQVKIMYDDGVQNKENGAKGKKLRIIQPVACGLLKGSHALAVRAFQPYGDTKTKSPGWKTFYLSRITKWSPTVTVFQEPPGAQWNAEGKYNETGDKMFDDLYFIADFKGAQERYNSNNNIYKHNAEVEKQKTEEDPFYKLRRQMKPNRKVNGMDVDYIRKNVEDWQKKNGIPNAQSAEEMSRAKDFGDDSYEETDEPVKKGQIEPKNNKSKNNMNYKNAADNGPVYKKPQRLKPQKQNNDYKNIRDLEDAEEYDENY